MAEVVSIFIKRDRKEAEEPIDAPTEGAEDTAEGAAAGLQDDAAYKEKQRKAAKERADANAKVAREYRLKQ